MVTQFDYQRESEARIRQQTKAWPAPDVQPGEVSEKEAAICRKLDKMYELILSGPNRCEPEATEHLTRYKGRYQPPRSAIYRWPRANYNRTMIDMDMKLALQLDSTLNVTVTPATDPTQELNAIAMEQLLRNIARSSNMEAVRIECDMYGGLMGTAVKMVRIKPGMPPGQEEIVVEAVDPRTIGVDPNATSTSNINFIMRFVTMTYHEIARVYGKDIAARLSEHDSVEGLGPSPKEGAILIREAWYLDDTTEEQEVPIPPDPARDHLADANAEMQIWLETGELTVKPYEDHKRHMESVHVPFFTQISESLEQARATLAHYENIPEEELAQLPPEEITQLQSVQEMLAVFTPEKMMSLRRHIEEHTHALNNPRKEIRVVPKYPYGRLTVATRNKVLYDQPNPYPGFPFFFVPEHQVPGQIFGVSDVLYNKGLTDTTNRLLDKAVDIVRNISNITVVPEGQKDKLTNAPAQIVEGSPGDYGIVQSGDLPAGLRHLLPLTITLQNHSSGNEEIVGGRRLPNIISGAAMDRLIEGTRRRPNLKVKRLVAEERRMYMFIAKLICERYTGVRVLRLTGERGEELAEQLRKQEERYGRVQTEKGKKRTFLAPPITYKGKYADVHYFEIYTERLSPEIDISIEIGLDAERSAVEEGQLAVQLFQLGAIDQIELLNKLRYKNAKEVVERMGVTRNLQQQVAQVNEMLKVRDKQLNQAFAEIKRLQDQVYALRAQRGLPIRQEADIGLVEAETPVPTVV